MIIPTNGESCFVKYPGFINQDDQWADHVEGLRLSWFLPLIIIRRCRGYERGTYISWPSGVLHTLRIGGLHFVMNLLEANESLLILMSIIILILIIIILIILNRSEQIIRYSNIIRLLEAEYYYLYSYSGDFLKPSIICIHIRAIFSNRILFIS